MIVSIFKHRLSHVFADIQVDICNSAVERELIAVGQIINELIDIWAAPIGNVVMDSSGTLWLDRESLLDVACPCPIPNTYLARSIESFRHVAELNCEVGKLAFLPRSQQWKFIEAEATFRNWVQANDPRCLDDPGSYWNELRRDEY